MSRQRLSLLIFCLVLIISAGLALWWHFWHLPPQTLRINHQHFTIRTAQTADEQIRGLAGVHHLEPNEGMLFLLDGQPTAFWMKGMLIDLDIIWVRNNTIVGINHSVPAPEVGTPDALLPNYPSPVANPQAVLEIASGQAQAQGITIGDSVIWRE